MVRPRRDTQDVLLERIAHTLERRQSLQPWTLAEIAPGAGLSPAGLVKRFGSRQGILLALSHRWIASIPDSPRSGAPEEELRGWVAQRFRSHSPDGAAHGLVSLLDDLADEQLRGLLAEGWLKELGYLTRLLEQAGLSRLSEPRRGARLLFDALNGAMLRQAAQADAPTAHQVLDDFLEVWA